MIGRGRSAGSIGRQDRAQGSIAKQLLILVFSIYIFISLIITAVQLVEAYAAAKKDLTRELRILGNSFKGALAKSLWEFDEEGVNSAVKGLLEIPGVLGVKVLNPKTKEIIDAGGAVLNRDGEIVVIDPTDAKNRAVRSDDYVELFWQEFEVTFEQNGARELVARALIYSNNTVVFERIKYRALITILSEIIEITVLWVIFLLVSRKMLAQPLAVLTAATERLSQEELKDFKVDIQSKNRNELTLLEEAFNSSAAKLHEAKDELENRMRLALNAGRIATWVWYPKEDQLDYDAHMPSVFGQRSEGFANSFKGLLDVIHQDDRDRFAEEMSRAIAENEHLYSDIRAVAENGSILNIEVQAVSHRADETNGAFNLVGTVMDITERKQIAIELEEARDAAELANKAKSEFLASMSHELRTPLNAILGFSEIITGQHLGPGKSEKYREYAGDIHKSGVHLLELVNDLLDLASIEAGKKELSTEPSSIIDLIDECNHIIADRALAKGIAMHVNATNEPPSVLLDRRAIKQVMLNLLTNAIKFTQAGGSISIETGESLRGVRFSVIDNGEGIPQDMLQDITDPFKTAARDPHLAEKGWGLGLAISKSLVELHNGTMDIESNVGKGTTVTVELPLNPENDITDIPAS